MSGPLVSSAQNAEDMILHVLLHRVDEGFYVDVGANDPVDGSVTKFFYDRGWHGINIEPNPELCEQLERARPLDVNLNVGASDRAGSLTFRQYGGALHGLSTFEPEIMRLHAAAGHEHVDRDVAVVPLAEILEQRGVTHIDFLKVDAEGHEMQVLAGNDWNRFRPTVVVVEASIRETEQLMAAEDYERVFFDGLNFYFLDKRNPGDASIWDYSRVLLEPGYYRRRELDLVEQVRALTAAQEHDRPRALVSASLAQARLHGDLGGIDPGPTRLRRVKSLVLRTMRIATHHQVAHNRAMEDAVEVLAQQLDRRQT